MAGLFSLDFASTDARKPKRFYLAYGSNLSLERMKDRCPDAVVLGTAVIPGYRLLFKKSKTGSYATIEQDANCCVPALVYRISELDEALLDRYEGYPRYYYKRNFRLSVTRLDSGRRMKERKWCMAYVMPRSVSLGNRTWNISGFWMKGTAHGILIPMCWIKGWRTASGSGPRGNT